MNAVLFNKFLYDVNGQRMMDLIRPGQIISIFQFNSIIMLKILKTLKQHSYTCVAFTAARLSLLPPEYFRQLQRVSI